MLKSKKIYLNLGSGPSGLSNWINLDWGILPFLSKFSFLREILVNLKILPKSYKLKWPEIKLFDIRRKLPFENQSVDFIYCSHVLEHFEIWEALKILNECKRVLKKGGWLRVVIPDINKMIKIYQEHGAEKFCCLWWGYPKNIKPKNFLEKISRKFIRDHQWHYDQKEIAALIKQAGFSKVCLREFQKGKVKDINKLDLFEVKNHSLYMEASY